MNMETLLVFIMKFRNSTRFCIYELEFADGEVRLYTTNGIAANIYCQVDQFGRRDLIFTDIIDHWRNEYTIKKQDKYVTFPFQSRFYSKPRERLPST